MGKKLREVLFPGRPVGFAAGAVAFVDDEFVFVERENFTDARGGGEVVSELTAVIRKVLCDFLGEMVFAKSSHSSAGGTDPGSSGSRPSSLNCFPTPP